MDPHPPKNSKISFSPSAEDYIRRFMNVAMAMAKHKFPTVTSWIASISWTLSTEMTYRATGETVYKGSEFGIGALEIEKLTDEFILHLNNGLDVAIGILPDDLTSLDHIAFDLRDDHLVIPGVPGYDPLPRPYVPF